MKDPNAPDVEQPETTTPADPDQPAEAAEGDAQGETTDSAEPADPEAA